jgi:GLPGLI family protein
MNKRTILVFLCAIQVNFLWSQEKGFLTYRLTKNDERFGKREFQYVIYFNNKSSVEFPVKKTLEELKLKNDENHDYVILNDKKPSFIYKNFSNKNLYFNGMVGFKPYLTNDTLSNFKWKITKEKATMLNYNCTKATTNFRDRNYVAWYTEDVAIQNGPWKFCGLPGLIIKVEDDKQMFSYQLVGIDLKVKFDEQIISIPKAYIRDKPISYHEYMGLYEKKIMENIKLSKVVQRGKDGSYGTVTIIQAEMMEKF